MKTGTRQFYRQPEIEYLGRVERLTMGNNGSSWDGTWTYTQHGPGNDAYGPATGQGDPNPNGSGSGGGEDNGHGAQKPKFPPNYHPSPPGQNK